MRRGDVVLCVLSGDYGKPRPAVVVQSNVFTETHESVTVCPFTTDLQEAPLFRLLISPNKENGLQKTSQIMIDKVMSLKRNKIREKIGALTLDQIKKVDDALIYWQGLTL